MRVGQRFGASTGGAYSGDLLADQLWTTVTVWASV